MKKESAKYPDAELIWSQEEHKNQGAWTYVQPRFYTALNGSRPVTYVSNILHNQVTIIFFLYM